MASKKRKPKKRTKKSRSLAAKKGHVTRKLNKKERILLDAIKTGNKKVIIEQLQDIVPELAFADAPDWLRRMPPAMMREHYKMLQKIKREGWVPAQEPEYTYSGKKGANQFVKGAIALQPSRLRHLGRETDKLLTMLRKAARQGEDALDLVATEIAEAYDVPIREVYTLWYSP